ncbi:MAG: ROK family protein [Actinomycetes bacterium]
MLRAGVDLGGTKIQVVISDPLNRVLGAFRRPTPRTGGPPAVTEAIAAAIRQAAADGRVDLADVTGIGVGAPGHIDAQAGTVANAGNLPDWMITYPLSRELSARLRLPVALGNDVQVAVNAEVRLGAGRPYHSMIGVFCGTGVGGGVVIDDELWLGRGAAGELGHICVQTEGGAPCPCGRRGCMEAYAGRAAMEIQARRWRALGKPTQLFDIMAARQRERLTSGVWYRAMKRKDPMAKKLLKRAVWALGSAIGSTVNALDVEAVIIGGGLGLRLGQPFVDSIRDAMIPHLVAPQNPPAVLLAELGDLGGAIGAALLVTERRSDP